MAKKASKEVKLQSDIAKAEKKLRQAQEAVADATKRLEKLWSAAKMTEKEGEIPGLWPASLMMT